MGYETNVRISSKVNKVITDKINNARSLLASQVCPYAHVKIFECATQLQYTLMQIRTSLKRLQPLNQLAQTLARIWLGKDGIARVSKGLLAQLALLVRLCILRMLVYLSLICSNGQRIEDTVLFIKPEENGSLWTNTEKKIKHFEDEKKLGRDHTTPEWIRYVSAVALDPDITHICYGRCMDDIILDEEHRFTQFKQYINSNPESEVAIAVKAEMDKRKDGGDDDNEDEDDGNNNEGDDDI